MYAADLQGDKAWVAFYDRVPVALALASKSQQGEMFHSDVFGRAFKAQASEHGIQTAMANLGFDEIKPEIQVGDYVQAEIASQVALKTEEVTAAAERDKAELSDRLNGALATAALGLSQGFFKGHVNPIAQSLIESLSAVGLDNASALVNQAFAQHSSEYHKTLLAKANTILGYGLETQNEITEAIAGSNAVGEQATASAAPVPLGRPVQVGKKDPVRQEATASNVNMPNFAARLARVTASLGKRT